MKRALLRGCLGVGLLFGAAACSKTDAPSHIKRAQNAVFERKPEEALREYRAALDVLERDRSAEAAVYQARALRGAGDVYYLELRDFRRAVQVYRELIQQCPEAPETLEGRIHLADILQREMHDLRGAVAELSAALARNPPQGAELSFRVAKLYFELGDYQQCEIESQKVASKFDASGFVDDALYLRGQALSMMEGRRLEAQRVYLDLIDRFPESEFEPQAWLEVGKLRADASDNAHAIDAWVEALKRHPQPTVVQTFIARARKQLLATTPSKIGDEAKAFDRDVPGAYVPMPKTSAEAVGGTADEALREKNMKVEPAPREVP